ncbi:MAG TPA: hypothetical protein PLP23_01935 [Panacibacter sp.]|nr:hypothetical protein [Panacibacter sp.]
MKKIIILTAIVFAIIPHFVSAQFGYGKVSEIEELKTRKLIVIIEEPKDKVIKKITKKKHEDKIPVYKAAINEYNAKMKQVAEKFWTFSKNGIEYKTYQEVDELRKAKNKDYAILYCLSGEMSDIHSGFDESSGLNWTWNTEDDAEDRDYFDGFTEMKVSLLEDMKSIPIMYTVLPDIFPTVTSLVLGMQTLQTYMDIRVRQKKDGEDISQREYMNNSIKKNNHDLAGKTLLIREDMLSKKLDKSKIADAYPYKFEIVNKEKLDSIVFNTNTNYIYAMVMPAVNSGTRTNSVYYFQAAIGAGNGEYYGLSMPNIAATIFSAGIAGHGKKYVEEKNLQDFVKGKTL